MFLSDYSLLKEMATATDKNRRHGLLTFAHGTFYGLQLLQHEIYEHTTKSDELLLRTQLPKQGSMYKKIGSVEIEEMDNQQPNACKQRLKRFWSQCTCSIVCRDCPGLRPYSFAIMGLFRIVPQAILITQQNENGKSIAIISFIAYCITTLTAMYYYLKFLYYFCYLKEYKFALLDDIKFEEVKASDDDSVPLVVGSKTYGSSHSIDQIEKRDSKYSDDLFGALAIFMAMVLIMDIGIGFYTFIDIFAHDNDQFFNMMASVSFIIFAYPFIGSTMCFIELQLMNELLHETKLHDNDDDIQYHLLSSNSSFWYLFGYILNHFPILYFMNKVACYMCFYMFILVAGHDIISIIDPDSALVMNPSWVTTMFQLLVQFLYFAYFLYETHFVKVLNNGYRNLYPPIKNQNIENVRPPNNPCPNETLERMKNALIATIEFLTPYSFIIECSIILINSTILFFYLVVWDKYISSKEQFDETSAVGAVLLSIAIMQIVVVVYAFLGEKCCYSAGPEYCCNEFLCNGRQQCCSLDCCCKCVKCCKCKSWYCWCCFCGVCCCTPKCFITPDYKLRFMTFLESASLLFKLIHYYNNSTLNNTWYDIGFMILIFLSLLVLFLLGFAGAFRSIHGLEVQSIMKSSKLFVICYVFGFSFTQFVVYGNFIFTATFKGLEEINENSTGYQSLIFSIFLWIIISNVYTKEYRAFTKQIERDWFQYQGIELIGFDIKHSLPPMLGSLFHFLQLFIILAVTVILFYIVKLATVDETNENWKFENRLAITNLICTIIVLIITLIAVWSISLSPKALRETREQKIRKNPTILRRMPTVYHEL